MVKCEKQGAWRGGSTHVICWLCDLRMLHSPHEHLSFSHLFNEIKEMDVLGQVLNRREQNIVPNAQCPKALKWLKKKAMNKKNEFILQYYYWNLWWKDKDLKDPGAFATPFSLLSKLSAWQRGLHKQVDEPRCGEGVSNTRPGPLRVQAGA